MARTTVYFAVNSDVSLNIVCSVFQSRFNLPDFVSDWHDTWQYAFSKTSDIGFNVTKAEGSATIETWMDGCPSDVNFQIIVDFEVEPADLADTLQSALGVVPVRYLTKMK